jgi:hypothetical protein
MEVHMADDEKTPARTKVLIAIIGALALILAALISAYALLIVNHVLPSPFPGPATPTATPSAGPPSDAASAVPSPTEETNWVITFEYAFPPDHWPVGGHEYTLEESCPLAADATFRYGTWTNSFQVSQAVSLLPGSVYLRLAGPKDDVLRGNPVDSINPSQPTMAAFNFAESTHAEAEWFSKNCVVTVRTDSGLTYPLVAGVPYQR